MQDKYLGSWGSQIQIKAGRFTKSGYLINQMDLVGTRGVWTNKAPL